MRPTDEPVAAEELEDTDPSWLPDEESLVPLEVDPADWVDQERVVPDDPSDEAPRT